jgi:3-hydroxyacyl-[acyl-carrier-protein] dehydratase
MSKDSLQIDFQSVASVSNYLLSIIPQQAPFRFIDRVIEIDQDRIVGEYTFRPDEVFYAGHFPKQPVTPGVILIEAMAQTAVVAFGLYLRLLETQGGQGASRPNLLTVFTDVEAEFHGAVFPGERVVVKAEKIFWRRNKLKSRASMFRDNGELVATATLAGMGVEKI